MADKPAAVTVNVHMEQLHGAVALAASTELSPADVFLNALGEADGFPAEIADAILDSDGEVILQVGVGGGTYLELTQLLEQLDANPVLSTIATDGKVEVAIVAKAATTVKLQVALHNGEVLGEVDLLPDATGTDLLQELCNSFCADSDMQTAIVEQPGRKEGKWLPIPEPFVGYASLLEKATTCTESLLIFVRPTSPPTSIAQLRVRLPCGGAFKPVPNAAQQIPAAPNTNPPATATGMPAAPPAAPQAATKNQRAKLKQANATAQQDASKVATARCLQGEREKRFMAHGASHFSVAASSCATSAMTSPSCRLPHSLPNHARWARGAAAWRLTSYQLKVPSATALGTLLCMPRASGANSAQLRSRRSVRMAPPSPILTSVVQTARESQCQSLQRW
jgi:hypothetical protein